MTTQSDSPTSTTPKKRTPKMASSQSLNHLLNFTLPPRQTQNVQSIPRRSRRTGTQQGVWNKERFVNAQYRFVMNPTGDYTVHFADPDIFFQWHDILQIIVPRMSMVAPTASSGERIHQDEGQMTCPICLSPPVAPRMTKCGHVYCFPCILHLLNTSDNLKWVRCPICFDSINDKQLKSVKWFDGMPSAEDRSDHPAESSSSSVPIDSDLLATPVLGSTIRMRLMQRPQITTLALPRSPTWPSDLIPPHQAPFHFLPDVFAFSKFMLATPSYLIAALTKDLDDLAAERRILAGMGDELSLIFIDSAQDKVRHQIAKASALETPQLTDVITRAYRDQHEIEDRVSTYNRRVTQAASLDPIPDAPLAFLETQSAAFRPSPSPRPVPPHTPGNSAPMASASSIGNRTSRQRRNVNPPPPSTQTYYYYQSTSGLPIFLHPLDIKILFSHFHSYASFPDTITFRVEAYSEGSVNDDLRKRCKYLAHMPEGADVVFVEADLEGVVGIEGLRSFEGALKSRRARRKEKGKKDDKAKARAEEREKEKLAMVAASSWSSVTRVVPSPVVMDRSDTPVEEFAIPTSDPEPEHAPSPQPTGVWGARSFASALHASSASGRPSTGAGQRAPRREETEDEYDWDAAWHDLEQRGGGRKKRGSRMIVLGGGGAGGRRR